MFQSNATPYSHSRKTRRSRRVRTTRNDCPYLPDDPRAVQWWRQQARNHRFDGEYAPRDRAVGVDRL
jgi:hypothetical protein